MSLKRSVNLLLLLTGLLFLGFLLFLSFYNRPASDDYQFISRLNESGFRGSLSFYYNNWSVRWTSLLYFNLLFSMAEDFAGHRLYISAYYLFSLMLLITVTCILLRRLLSLFFEELPSPVLLLTLSLLFQASVFFTTPHTVEIWFWILASFIYLQAYVFLITGMVLLFSGKNNIWFSFFPIPFFIYIGGAHEGFALMVLSIMAILFAGLYKWKDTSVYRKRIAIGAAAVIFSFGINISNSGALVRKEKERTRPPQERASFNKSALDKLGESLIQKKNLAFSVLPWIWLGFLMRTSKRKPQAVNIKTARLYGLAALMLPVLGIISLVPVLYVFRSLGPERCLFPFVLLLNVYAAFLFFRIGNRLSPGVSAVLPPLAAVILVLNTVLFSGFAFRNFLSARQHALEYDRRIDYLLSLEREGRQGKVWVSPLPDPGPFLLSGDIMAGSVCFPSAIGVKSDITLRR